MLAFFKWTVFLIFSIGLSACGDADPQVDFLNKPSLQKKIPPGKTSSNSLSQPAVLSGGTYKVKGRVSFLENQKTQSGGSYKVEGKISF